MADAWIDQGDLYAAAERYEAAAESWHEDSTWEDDPTRGRIMDERARAAVSAAEHARKAADELRRVSDCSYGLIYDTSAARLLAELDA